MNNVSFSESTLIRQSLCESPMGKSLMESSILKSSTMRHSKLENEIFAPDDDDSQLQETSCVSICNEEKQRQSYENRISMRTDLPISSIDKSELHTLYTPIYRIKTLPPYTICKRNCSPLLPPQDNPNKLTLVLDLDETLVHCSTQPIEKCHYIFPLLHNGSEMRIFVRIRPYARQLLEYCSLFCEIVIFTASIPAYGNTIINLLDPERKFISHRLFREHCTYVDGAYIKDLNLLGRDLKRTVIVDNSIVSFAFHLNNGVPILSWFDDWEDRELYELAKLLYSLFPVENIPLTLESIYHLEEIIDAFEICPVS